MDFSPLMKNLTDTVREGQLKLGYSPNPVSLNYPLGSLNALLGTRADAAGMEELLKAFAGEAEGTLGRIGVRREEDRFTLTVPPEGTAYVLETVPASPFLTDLIALITGPGRVTAEEILGVFRRYSPGAVCKPVEGEEFNYLFYFPDGSPDDYRYCVEVDDDFGRASYHRLTPADYEQLGFGY